MAAFDTRKYFDQDQGSDVTVYTGSPIRTLKCHKVILCNGSDLAKHIRPCWPRGPLQITVLQQHHPEAVEAMLRHLYGFQYDERDDGTKKQDLKPLDNLRVYVVATKYLVPALQAKALDAFNNQMADLGCLATLGDDPERLFELVKLLATYKEHDEAFPKKSNKTLLEHLPALMKLNDFRTWLGEEGNLALEVMLRSATEEKEIHYDVSICRKCLHTAVLCADDKETVRCCSGNRLEDFFNAEVKEFSYKDGKLSVASKAERLEKDIARIEAAEVQEEARELACEEMMGVRRQAIIKLEAERAAKTAKALNDRKSQEREAEQV